MKKSIIKYLQDHKVNLCDDEILEMLVKEHEAIILKEIKESLLNAQLPCSSENVKAVAKIMADKLEKGEEISAQTAVDLLSNNHG